MSTRKRNPNPNHPRPTASPGQRSDMMLRMFYATAYDYLKSNPDFDGRPHPDHPGMLRARVDPGQVQPWPGVADVPHMSRDEWVTARLEAVRRGEEKPPLGSRGVAT